MKSGVKEKIVEIRVFGSLRRHLEEQGLPATMKMPMEQDESRAFDLACKLGLPPEEVEAVFCNGHVQNIYDPVHPGDRLAFLPYGIPGPYRAFLGIWKEGLKAEAERKKAGEGTVDKE
jgi:hypothetical protein